MKNIIQTQLTAAIQNDFDDLLSQIESLMAGKFVALDEAERVKYGSINEQNKLLVNKVRDYHLNNPTTSAPDVDWTEFEANYQARWLSGKPHQPP